MSETRQTVRVWEADLGEDGRKLTLDELVGLEQMHACQQLQQLVEAVRLQAKLLSSLEGRFDRLEQFLGLADARYPRAAGQPMPVLAEPRR
jgi:hypothetical protein